MKEIAEDGRNPFILSQRKTGREEMLCHLVVIPSGCFCFQDIGCVSGKLPASRETYWITDNLGMDRASTEDLYKRGRGRKRWVHTHSFSALSLTQLPLIVFCCS